MSRPPQPSVDGPTTVDFAQLYEGHAEYAARRNAGSFEHERVSLEVNSFKLPNLTRLLPHGWAARSVIEIGCATGELIAGFPIADGGRRVGLDISLENVEAARVRHPFVEFLVGDGVDSVHESFDCVILSDVLEHVTDDAGLLASAANIGRLVLVNLPLEDNWLNLGRKYGPQDSSGHLRKYSHDQGLDLFRRAGLRVVASRRVWVHETETDTRRRELRRRFFGTAYDGIAVTRIAKALLSRISCAVSPFGRRLFASNLFVLATRGSAD